jgi:4-hydroxy-4-methyl-2-oxoglutarate aldolase
MEPGGLISGDMNGILVVPRAIEEVAIARACEKASGEKSFAK